jgi:hypothetical protein
LFRDGI